MAVRPWLETQRSQHLDDLVHWILDGMPEPSPALIKLKTVEQYVKKSGFSVFIETGTHQGVTTDYIAPLVKKVCTIELSPEYYTAASDALSVYPHVECLLGDSASLISAALLKVNEPAVFWLDGHYSGGTTALGMRVSPILEELHAIFMHHVKDHVILIDDARLFDGVSYPAVRTITDLVRYYLPGHFVEIRNDIFRITPVALSQSNL